MSLRCVEVRESDRSGELLAVRRADADTEIAACTAKLNLLGEALPLMREYGSLGKGVREYEPKSFEREKQRERAYAAAQRTLELKELLNAEERKCSELRARELSLLPWLDCDLPLGDLETKTTRTRLGTIPKGVAFSDLQAAVEEIEGCAEAVWQNKGISYVAVTVFLDREREWNALAAELGFLEVVLPVSDGTAVQARERLEQEIRISYDRMSSLIEELQNVSEQLGAAEILHDLISTDRSVAELRRKLAQTECCSVLEGWVPEHRLAAVESLLSKFECAYEARDPLEDEDPPILLRNNKFVRNFEWVVGMYSYPKYGRFDPTAIMSVFYFLIFGLIFADVGYGFLLTVGGFAGSRLMKRKPSMQKMLLMFGYCGISAMLAGVLFGGWLGDLPTAIMQNVLHIPTDTPVGRFFSSGLLFSPLDNPLGFMAVSLIAGGIHLLAGMGVNFYILCRDGKVKEALSTVATLWVLFAGLLLLLVNTTLGLIVAGVGALLVIAFMGYGIRNPFKRIVKGLGGIYGLINYVSDLLSYSRILALGLVAAVVAKVVNMITMMSGGWGTVVVILVMILGHGINLVLNVLGAFVHTSRLQYMEFFGKFYEDGGKPFEPAAPTEQYSEAVTVDEA
ncbi:MAG: hypothetical protein E7620_04630 [Ruminococcaceae bacterium]|nr:hypothetical protein [Oscillospiraceae bacterium]